MRPHLPQLDLHLWIERLSQIERQVCRIEISGGAAGTGFLVGPRAILTNWHVVEGAISNNEIKNVACRFDYYRRNDGARQEGVVCTVPADGCASHRPYSPAEETDHPDAPPPTEDQLDYALLRLDQDVGKADIGAATRGWLRLPAQKVLLETGAPVLIVQCPDGGPLKIALDTNAVIASQSEYRIRYATNTEPGSSGSPCFTINWDLAALHHFGDPASVLPPEYNQGIPIHLVRGKVEKDGFGNLIN